METTEHIRDILRRLPNSPGVYQHFDKEGHLLYVGKAKDLRARVSSYFNKNKYETGKTRLLVKKIHDIRCIVVETELDALLLENSLIKKHQPRYNIQLKDDKTYPWIIIRHERFPRVYATRQVVHDGSEYFGPYASVRVMRSLLDLFSHLFPLRTCNYPLSEANIAQGKFRLCLEYHIGNCLGPCAGKVDQESYDRNIVAIRQILKGNLSDLLRELKDLMKEHAVSYRFEQAQQLKERIELLQRFQAKSTIVNPSINRVEVFSICSDAKSGYVNYLSINSGAIVQSHTVELRKKLDEQDAELLAYAIIEIRGRYNSQSSEIIVPFALTLEIPGVKWVVPQRGDKHKLLELSDRNARYYMRDRQKQSEAINPGESRNRVLETLQRDLHLPSLPVHIECFDNSNIQGTNPASACVVFRGGKPAKKEYRKFNIRSVKGPNDFASMEEVVRRRYSRTIRQGEELPQLVIIDGGKGQLSSALKIFDELGIRGKVSLIGIAKRLEEIYFPGDNLPVYIDKKSESLKLIQQLRNEAHRVSLGHHRDRRSKEALTSSLLDIPGIGPASAARLLRELPSADAIPDTPLPDLERILGRALGQRVWAHLHPDIAS